MKIVNLLSCIKDLLNLLRENGIKSTDFSKYTDIYYDFKAMRSVPGSKFDGVLRSLEQKYGIGHTKLWEIIKILDKDV